jgi:predicted dehydrogenase
MEWHPHCRIRGTEEAEMEMLRLGLIGAGFIGVAHANAIETIVHEKLVSAEFAAVCDADAERARAIADSFGAERHCTDPFELIGSGAIDTVFICTPTKFHPELVRAAAERSLNIFCEKPLARALSEAREMHAVVARAGVKNQVGLVLRFSPVYNVIRRLISEPSLGRPMSVIFRDDQYFPIRGIYGSAWRSDVSVSGGGTLIEHSIHDADILRWLFGEPRSVRGTIRNFAGHREVEDLAVAQFEFPGDCIGQLTSAWHNIMRRESNRYVEVFFENGYISSAHDFIGPIHHQTGNEDLQVISADEVLDEYLSSAGLAGSRYNSLHSMQGLQDYHFLRALETGATPEPDFEVAVRAHELVEAVYESDRNNCEIQLPL